MTSKLKQIHDVRAVGLYEVSSIPPDNRHCSNDIISKKTLDDDLKARIDAALKEYKQNFVAEQGRQQAA